MDTKQLNTFRHLAKSLNFSQTAMELNFAQSTVSAQIRSLENELRLTLFDRLGKKVALTIEGKSVLNYANRFRNIEDEFISSLKDDSEVVGELNIYAPNSICVYLLPCVLTQFRKKFPGVTFRLRAHLGTKRALEELKSGKIDMAILLEEVFTDQELNIQSHREEEIIFICSNDHPLAESVVSLNDLKDQNFITTEPTCGYRAILSNHLLSLGHKLDPVMWFDNAEAIKQCIMCDMGISFLPKIAAEEDIATNKIKQIHISDKFPGQIKLQSATHKQKWLNPALREFITALADEFSD
ncbi:MAG: LysR family transcriptional regulator [Kordiimonadaceae bacterium]|nr:LysR family transcriptional regulator [Kordiimonadaceae bacterium]